MSATPIPVYRYFRGLCTREAEEGGASPDRFVHFQNVRVGAGGAKRRAGCAQVAYPSTDHTAVDLNGSNQYFRIAKDTRVHTLRTYWTWECLINPDVVNATQYIWGEESASPTPGLKVLINSSGFPEVVVTLSDGTAHTMTSATLAVAGSNLGLQVVRDRGTIYFRQNNTVVVTTAIAAAKVDLNCQAPTNNLTIGRHNGGDYFNGKLDYVRGFSIARASHADYRMRFTDPRCEYVMFNYTGELDSNNWMRDHSRFESHAKGFNTPTETTALAIQDAMANGIRAYVDRSQRQRLLYAAGGRVHLVTI